MYRCLYACAMAFALALAPGAHAEVYPVADEYTPIVGQDGKDVVWVPTPDALVDRMLEMAKVTSKDYVMDLGSGDGRIAIAAAKKGARAVGIEYNPEMVELSNRNAKAAGVANKVKFIKADLFETDLSKADVITMYLLPRINLELRPKLLALKPGTRIVSHAFDLADWKADEEAKVEGRDAYLWIVPANIAGNWRVEYPDNAKRAPTELQLTQNFQLFWGHAVSGGQSIELGKPWLSGTKVRFAVRDADGVRKYTGEVKGDRMEGSMSIDGGAASRWVATRLR